jgi:hypothetical protein
MALHSSGAGRVDACSSLSPSNCKRMASITLAFSSVVPVLL